MFPNFSNNVCTMLDKFDFGKIRLKFYPRTYVRYWKLSKNVRTILDKSVNICTLLDKLIILNILHYIKLQVSSNHHHGRDQEWRQIGPRLCARCRDHPLIAQYGEVWYRYSRRREVWENQKCFRKAKRDRDHLVINDPAINRKHRET